MSLRGTSLYYKTVEHLYHYVIDVFKSSSAFERKSLLTKHNRRNWRTIVSWRQLVMDLMGQLGLSICRSKRPITYPLLQVYIRSQPRKKSGLPVRHHSVPGRKEAHRRAFVELAQLHKDSGKLAIFLHNLVPKDNPIFPFIAAYSTATSLYPGRSSTSTPYGQRS